MNKINPGKLAAKWDAEKIAEAAELTPAVRREILWFLQGVDMRPGGLDQVVNDLLGLYPGSFANQARRKDARMLFSGDNPAHARSYLAGFFRELCEVNHTGFHAPDYCPDLLKLLPAYLERHALETRKQIAPTEVTRIVFRELDFAISQNVPVPIVGESRIGKTSPAACWCNMRPGRARLVSVPESNRERDFVMAHADAFGVEYSSRISTHALRLEVQYVHRHSGLFICYDESQFLIPSNYGKSTPPIRLNYVRCQVIDRNLGCAFFATPQSYRQTVDQYVKKTGYAMQQWLGRMAPAVVLPADLGRQDLLAVAKLHFPEMPEPFLKLISARAMASEGYLKNMEITAKRARFLAGERGGKKVSFEDVQAAIEQMMPAPLDAAGVPRRPSASATRSPGRASPPPARPAGLDAAEDNLFHRSVETNRLPKGELELQDASK